MSFLMMLVEHVGRKCLPLYSTVRLTVTYCAMCLIAIGYLQTVVTYLRLYRLLDTLLQTANDPMVVASKTSHEHSKTVGSTIHVGTRGISD